MTAQPAMSAVPGARDELADGASGGVLLRLRGEQDGSLALWMLGLAAMLLGLGGLSFDLWHAFAEQRALAGAAEAASVAGASSVDVEHFRATGDIRLEVGDGGPGTAAGRARSSLATQADLASLTDATIEVDPSGAWVRVRLSGQVELTLLNLLLPSDDGPLAITVTSTSEPLSSG